MPFTLAFGFATALVTLLLFNSGMLANAKGRLQNAVDAGAYSAGVLQARDHNFSAYTNRAMVANQVAVVQLASLKSFLEDAADTHQRMDGPILTIEEWIPIDKPLWDAGHAIPIESVNSAFSSVAPAAVSGLDMLIKAFETAQEAHHVATMVNMALVADEVIKRNDPGAALTKAAFFAGRTSVQVNGWSNSTARHRANGTSAVSDRFADTVVSTQSTDEFTRNRLSVPTPKWVNEEVLLCRLLPNYAHSTTTFTFTHAGGSILSSDKKRWLALDATFGAGMQSCSVWVTCGIIPVPCIATETTPLIDDNFGLGGSGGAVVGRGGDYGDMDGYDNNPSSAKRYGNALISPASIPAWIRYESTGPGTSLDGAGGLQDYYRDVANPSGSLPSNQTPEQNGAAYGVTLEAERRGDSLRTSGKIMPGSSQLKMDERMQGDTMRALAAAQSYFYRPSNGNWFTHGGWSRADGRRELANLFSPYWQARLSDRSAADRAASWAAQ